MVVTLLLPFRPTSAVSLCETRTGAGSLAVRPKITRLCASWSRGPGTSCLSQRAKGQPSRANVAADTRPGGTGVRSFGCRRTRHLRRRLRPGGSGPPISGCRSASARVVLTSRRAISSAGERFVHTEEVTGSIPVSPTTSVQLFDVDGPGIRRVFFHVPAVIGSNQPRWGRATGSGDPVGCAVLSVPGHKRTRSTSERCGCRGRSHHGGALCSLAATGVEVRKVSAVSPRCGPVGHNSALST